MFWGEKTPFSSESGGTYVFTQCGNTNLSASFFRRRTCLLTGGRWKDAGGPAQQFNSIECSFRHLWLIIQSYGRVLKFNCGTLLPYDWLRFCASSSDRDSLAAGDGATGRTAGGGRGTDEAGAAWPTAAARVRPDGSGDRADGRALVLRHEVFRPQEACRALSAYVKYAT